MNHSEFKNIVISYLTGELDEETTEHFEMHFFRCNDCREYLLKRRAIYSLTKKFFTTANLDEISEAFSHIPERIEGLLFDNLSEHGIGTSALSSLNLMVLRNLQYIIAEIKGLILYRIDGLNMHGEITDKTTIEVIKKAGVLAHIPSRVETDNRLKGTKRIIVQMQNIYIGKGRKDNGCILLIPILSKSAAGPDIVSKILLLNVSLKNDVSTADKIRALGGKYKHIMNIVQGNSVKWRDEYLDMEPMDDLIGLSSEKIAKHIIRRVEPSTE